MLWCLTASCLKLRFFQFSLTPSKIKVLSHLPPPLYLDYSDKTFFIFLTWLTLISQPYNNRTYPAVPESSCTCNMNRRHNAYRWVVPDKVQWSWTSVVVLQRKTHILELKQSCCFTPRPRWETALIPAEHHCLSSPFSQVCLHSQCPGTLHIGSRSIPLTAATSSHMPNYRICSVHEAKSIPSAYVLLYPHELSAITGVAFSLEGLQTAIQLRKETLWFTQTHYATEKSRQCDDLLTWDSHSCKQRKLCTFVTKKPLKLGAVKVPPAHKQAAHHLALSSSL